MEKMPWYISITASPLTPIILALGSIIILAGPAGFGQQAIAVPLLLGLACGRLFRVDREPI